MQIELTPVNLGLLASLFSLAARGAAHENRSAQAAQLMDHARWLDDEAFSAEWREW